MKKVVGARYFGLIIALLGFLFLLVSLLADEIGIGGYRASIGWKQFTGMAVGMAAVVVGVFMYLARTSPPTD